MNALPPVPALAGDGWRDAVAAAGRGDATVAARVAVASASTGRRGAAARSGSDPSGAGYERMSLPDDAHRRLGRRLPQQHVPRRSSSTGATACRGGCSPGRGAIAARTVPGQARPSTTPARSSPSSTSTFATGRRRRPATAQVFVRPPVAPRTRPRRPPRRCGATSTRGRSLACASAAWTWTPVGFDRLGGPRRRRHRGRGTRAPARCRGASRSTSAPTTPGRSLLRLADRRSRARCSATRGVRLRVRSDRRLRPRQRQVVRRVPRRDVGADHAGHARPHPPRLLAGRPDRRRRRAARTPLVPGEWLDVVARAGGDDVDARAWPCPPAGDRRNRLAELLAAARAGDAGGRRRRAWP